MFWVIFNPFSPERGDVAAATERFLLAVVQASIGTSIMLLLNKRLRDRRAAAAAHHSSSYFFPGRPDAPSGGLRRREGTGFSAGAAGAAASASPSASVRPRSRR